MNMNKCVFSWLSISIISLSVLTSPARADVGDFLKGIIILDAIVKEQNKQRPSQGTSQVSNGGFNLQERKNIQTSLNALGYNAGSVDGALGPSSRKAVQQFQTANGFEATGRLTKAQYPILLRNAGLDDKIAEKFLVPEPTPLTSQEVRLLQESLAGLGYYSGAIDGLAGGGTARGVKNFLVDIGEDPDSVSVRDALIMAREANGDTVPAYLVTEQGVSGSIAQNLAAEFNADQYITDEDTMDLALARMALDSNPAYLDDVGLLRNWIKREFPEFDYGAKSNTSNKRGSKATQVTLDYYTGSDAPRAAAMAVLKEQILSAASSEPLKIKLATRVAVRTQDFVEGSGVPLFVHRSGNSYSGSPTYLQNARVFTPYLSAMSIKNANAPVFDFLPVDKPRSNAISEVLTQTGKLEAWINAYITVERVADAIATNSFEDEVQFVGRVDHLDLTIPRTRGAKHNLGGEVIYEYDLSEDQGAKFANAASLARSTGVPLFEGRLLHDVIDASYFFSKPRVSDQRKHDAAWVRLFNTLALRSSGVDNVQDILTYAYLAPDATYPDRPLGDMRVDRNWWSALSEFQKNRAENALASFVAPEILAAIPTDPIPFTQISSGVVGSYDFGTETFPILWDHRSVTSGSHLPFGSLGVGGVHEGAEFAVDASFNTMPTQLVLPPEQAEILAELLDSRRNGRDRRDIFLKTEGNILLTTQRTSQTNRGQNIQRFTHGVEVTSVKLYSDIGLSELITEIEITDGWQSSSNAAQNLDRLAPPVMGDEAFYMALARHIPGFTEDDDNIRFMIWRRQLSENGKGNGPLFGSPILPPHILTAGNAYKQVEARISSNDIRSFRSAYLDLLDQQFDGTVSLGREDKIYLRGLDDTERDLYEVFDSDFPGRVPASLLDWGGNGSFAFEAMRTINNNPVYFVLDQEHLNLRRFALDLNGLEPLSNASNPSFDLSVDFETNDALIDLSTSPAILAVKVTPARVTIKGRNGTQNVMVLNGSVAEKTGRAVSTLESGDNLLDIAEVSIGDDQASVFEKLAKLGGTYEVSTVDVNPYNSNSSCGVQYSRLQRDRISLEREFMNLSRLESSRFGSNVTAATTIDELTGDLREQYDDRLAKLGGALPAECRAQIGPIKTAIVADGTIGGGTIKDTINVFFGALEGETPRVVSVSRELRKPSGDFDLSANYLEKYGEDFVTIASSDAFWFQSQREFEKAMQNRAFKNRCLQRTPWPITSGSISLSGFEEPCGVVTGTLFRQNGAEQYLVDTDFVQNFKAQAEAKTSDVEKSDEPEIKL